MPRLFWFAALSLITAFAHADTTPPVYNRVSLSEQAGTDIRNDLMVATLYARHEGRQAKQLAERVNREIEEALSLVKKTPGIQVRTQGYNTQPVYEKRKITAWRVSQSIRLESTDSEVLGELLGRLQEKLKLQSLTYQVSPEQRRRHIDQVTRTALQRFQKRARMIAGAFGKKKWRLVRVSIDEGGSGPVPILRAEMMADMVSRKREPVAIESGTSRLTVQVNGEIELRD